jgi:4'-phosphopantetheinyl transferase
MVPSEGGSPGPGEVHVWYVFSDQVRDPRLLGQYEKTLSPDERERRDRFAFERDRHQFLVTRGMLRTLLGGYLGIEPSSCAFMLNPYGRPSLTTGDLHFNVSHTKGLVAVAFAREPEIGIDVEDLERRAVDADLPRRFFSPAEVEALESLPEAERASRFFDYWTLKEAYIKARGMGLSLPLDGFSMLIGDGAPRIAFTSSIDDDQARWQFAQFDIGPRHRLAVAVHRKEADLAIRVRELAPSGL